MAPVVSCEGGGWTALVASHRGGLRRQRQAVVGGDDKGFGAVEWLGAAAPVIWRPITEQASTRHHFISTSTAPILHVHPPRRPPAVPLLHASNLRILLVGAAVAHLSSSATTRASPYRSSPGGRCHVSAPPSPSSSLVPSPSRALSSADATCEQGAKPAICTADELHYVPVPGTECRLALWRHRPPPEVRAYSLAERWVGRFRC
ncbi:hypothetical protein GUJ93_ZPchr0001g31146 [Zizania palustris]|uniref:Uncharacterized protein n=1 Tax=Zizania palustris TaxID=103762 RepID=A0A8J5RL42_ZIZPA|nr:hypothetical protein GUJ93_ZPchr0001g31146 [Zizania palustris]